MERSVEPEFEQTSRAFTAEQARVINEMIEQGRAIEIDGIGGTELVDACLEGLRESYPDTYTELVNAKYDAAVEDINALHIHRRLHYAARAAGVESVRDLATEDLQVQYELQLADNIHNATPGVAILFRRHGIRGDIEIDWYASLQYARDLVDAADELVERHYKPSDIFYDGAVMSLVQVLAFTICRQQCGQSQKEQLYHEYVQLKERSLTLTTDRPDGDRIVADLPAVFEATERLLKQESTPSIALDIIAKQYVADTESRASKHAKREMKRRYARFLPGTVPKHDELTPLGIEALHSMGLSTAFEKVLMLAALSTQQTER